MNFPAVRVSDGSPGTRSVRLKPLVSWPDEIDTGRKYLVVIDVEFDPESSPWPYDTEEYEIGCMLEGEPGLAVESVGDTTLVLHRFGGTYGPARFVTYAVGEGTAVPETALRLTLITAGGVPFRSERLGVRVRVGEPAGAVAEVEVPLLRATAEPAAPMAEPTGTGEVSGTVLIAPGSYGLHSAVRRRLTEVERRPSGWRHQVEVGLLPGTGWRVALVQSNWHRPDDGDREVVTTTSRELGASVVVSVVQGSEVRPHSDHGDIVVATSVALSRGEDVQASERLLAAAHAALQSSALFDRVATGGPSGRSRDSAAAVGGADEACLRAAYAVSGMEHLTICAIGSVAVERAAEAVAAVLARVSPDADSLALPPPPGRLVGRDAELRRLLDHLDPSSADESFGRVTLVHGVPGIGKTALALAAAHRAAEREWFPGGVYWVTGATDPAAVRQAMSRLARDHGRVLVVHDGMPSAEEPEPWPADGDVRVHLLITSRRGPADVRRTPAMLLQPLSLDAAVRLLDHGSHPAVSHRVAELCGGVPLALRLAREFPGSLDDLLFGIESGGGVFHVLDALRHAYDAEFRQLSGEQRWGLRLLALLPGGISEDVIIGAFGSEGLRGPEWLAHEGLAAYDDTRRCWYLPALVRAYGEQVVVGDEARRATMSDIRSRLWEYCTDRTRDSVVALGLTPAELPDDARAGRGQALSWLDGEHEPLIALARAGLDFGPRGEVVDFVIRLGAYLNWRRYFEECVACCTSVLEEGEHSHEMAHVWNLLGAAQRGLGQLDDASVSHLRAQSLFDEHGDEWGSAKCCDALGLVHAAQGLWPSAITLHSTARDTFRRLGDRRGEAEAMTNLGAALLESGDEAEAQRQLRRAVELCHGRDDLHGLTHAALIRAEALRRTGSPSTAVELAAGVMRDLGELAHTHGLGRAWEIQGRAHEDLRQYAEAQRAYAKAEESYTMARDPGRAELVRRAALGLGQRTTGSDVRVVVSVTPAPLRAALRWSIHRQTGPSGRETRSPSSGSAARNMLARDLSRPLHEALVIGDSVVSRVPVEIALPPRHFDLEPHRWPIGEHPERPLGEERPVVVRDVSRTGTPGAAWHARWRNLRGAGSPRVWHIPVISTWRQPVPDDAVPYLCGSVTQGPGQRIMSRLLKEGHGVVLWVNRPHPEECGEECWRQRDDVSVLLSRLLALEDLPWELWQFRDRRRDHTLSLLYDNPEAPLPGSS